MSAFFRLVLDEHIERELKERLEALGHDAERVVEIDELGPGAEDHEIVEYCERTGRMIVTFDDHYLSEHDAVERIGVLFEANDRRPPFELASRIDRIADFYTQNELVRAKSPVYVNSDEWA